MHKPIQSSTDRRSVNTPCPRYSFFRFFLRAYSFFFNSRQFNVFFFFFFFSAIECIFFNSVIHFTLNVFTRVFNIIFFFFRFSGTNTNWVHKVNFIEKNSFYPFFTSKKQLATKKRSYENQIFFGKTQYQST